MTFKTVAMKKFLILLLIFYGMHAFAQTPAEHAVALQKSIAKGWNSWDNNSLLSFTYMPQGFTINLAFKEYRNATIMQNPLLYKKEQLITLGAHSDDGSYSDLAIEWQKMKFRVQSATDADNLVILVSPIDVQAIKTPVLVAEAGIVWQMSGSVTKNGDQLKWKSGDFTTSLFSTSSTCSDPYLKLYAPYNVYQLSAEIGISTGKKYSISEIRSILLRNSATLEKKKQVYGDQSKIFDALQTAVAWNTVYDPLKQRVITPVSRSWSDWHGGYVLFCWDTYFASYMISLYDKELAYANAIAITDEAKETGFVPNLSDAIIKNLDRSQPPVGSFCVREIYRKYREKWFLELLYDKLLTWNRWWAAKRDLDGLLAWGSNSYQPTTGNHWETKESGVGTWKGASLESGMDNSPMYDQMPFDQEKELMKLWDVGLNSMYIMDCNALADIAMELGKTSDYKEIMSRANKYSGNLNKLWNEKLGIYCNRRTDTGEFSTRLSPTCFYPLLTDVPDQKKIDRMMKEHFYNPSEFYGKWILPSISKNDPDFNAQGYWTGRIWPPLNFLVYLGLRKHNLIKAKEEMVAKSKTLLLNNWKENHYLCENYNVLTGIGAEKGSQSDPFYHWGALLGFMDFIESGKVEAPEKSLH